MRQSAAAVRGRAVHDQQRDASIAWGQHDVDRIPLVDVSRDLLAARQQIVPVEGVAMGERRAWLPGTTRMHPVSGVLGLSAIHAVTTSFEERPQ